MKQHLAISLLSLFLLIENAIAIDAFRFKVLEDGSLEAIAQTIDSNTPEEFSPLVKKALEIVQNSQAIKDYLRSISIDEIELTQEKLITMAKTLISKQEVSEAFLLNTLQPQNNPKHSNEQESEFDWSSYDSWYQAWLKTKAYMSELF